MPYATALRLMLPLRAATLPLAIAAAAMPLRCRHVIVDVADTPAADGFRHFDMLRRCWLCLMAEAQLFAADAATRCFAEVFFRAR